MEAPSFTATADICAFNSKFPCLKSSNAALFLIEKDELKIVLSELHRILKSDGIGFLSFKEGEGIRVTEIEAGLEKRQLLYSYIELKELLKEAEFRVVLTERKEDQKRKGMYWLRYYVKKL